MLQEPSKKNLTEREFISMVAHDFISPLHTIRGYIEVLKMSAGEKLSETEHHPLNEITHISEECYETLETLVALFKNQDTHQKVQNINVEHFVDNLKKILHLEMLDKKIDILCKTEINHIKVRAGFLKQILLNLLKNAIKASPKESAIFLSFKLINKTFEITIEDKGPGLNQSFIKQNSFIHLDPQSLMTKNTREIRKGLGLYIIEHCLLALEGQLHVLTKPQGTIFRLILPTTPTQ